MGLSINDGIPCQYTSVHYATVADAISLIKSIGSGCYLAKTDIKMRFELYPSFPKITTCWDLNGGDCIILIVVL